MRLLDAHTHTHTNTHTHTQAKAGAAKGVAAGSRADEADDEACVMGDEDEQVPATSVSKRRKVEAVVKAGVRGGVGGAAAQGGAKGNVNSSSFVGDSTEEEEEEEEEAAAMVGRRGKAGGSDRGDNRGAQQDSKTISAKDQVMRVCACVRACALMLGGSGKLDAVCWDAVCWWYMQHVRGACGM